ncbi:hypothetical protein [Nocardioides sp. 1609]|uniref:hypothetical protein n=1 Tax=Nocardioides sp. 1609 TaxID=2508327 RepID=UPI00106F9382|nr:hypothetical protein [Nocardioides sp. 1609]
MDVVIGVVGGLVLLFLALWVGHRSLGAGGPSSAGGNALAGGFEVFDPARARAREDLDSKETEGEALPAPNDEDVPVRVDLKSGKVHVRRQPPAPPGSSDDAP